MASGMLWCKWHRLSVITAFERQQAAVQGPLHSCCLMQKSGKLCNHAVQHACSTETMRKLVTSFCLFCRWRQEVDNVFDRST